MEVNIDYVLKNGDPRVSTWFLMDSPTKPIIMVTLYLIGIKVIGPLWMQNKKPYDLRKYMIVYNVAMVGLSAWMFIRFALYGYLTTYSWICEPIDYSDNDIAVKAVVTCYVYFLSKFVEFLDTIFFVLRKKYSQITFLHLFHHASVPICSWYGCKYGGGGYALLLPMINVFVHIWMYLYYGLSALGPEVQKYLWWKKYLTKLQLMQFIVVIVFMTRVLIFRPENCNARDFITWLSLGQAIVFFVLFMHFYINSYKKSFQQPSMDSKSKVNGQNKPWPKTD